jgi:hypothetical protein
MLISNNFLAALDACAPARAQYASQLTTTGTMTYWESQTYLAANPPAIPSDLAVWIAFMDSLQTNPVALKYGSRYTSGNQWRLHSNNNDISFQTLAAAQTQRTLDMDVLLGDLNVRYSTVQVDTISAGHVVFVPLANATKDASSTFQVTDETHTKYNIIGWAATQAKIKELADAFRITARAVIYEKIIDTDDGFIAWDPLPG